MATVLRTCTQTVLLLLLVGAAWWVWLGWDEPGRGGWRAGDGVYHAWQGAGCLLTVLGLALLGYRRLAPALVGLAVAVGFSGAYAADVLGRGAGGASVLAVVVVTVGTTKGVLALGLLGPGLVGRVPSTSRPAR